LNHFSSTFFEFSSSLLLEYLEYGQRPSSVLSKCKAPSTIYTMGVVRTIRIRKTVRETRSRRNFIFTLNKNISIQGKICVKFLWTRNR